VAYYDLLARNELFIANGDALVVNGWNSVVGQSLTIRTRRRTPQGDLVTSENTLALTADRLANTLAISLNDGTLVGVAVHPTVAVQRGQTFVRIGLARGAGNPEQMTLAQDYVTIAAPLAWPGGRIASPTEGPGAIRSITGTDPPANASILETVPAGARWRLLSLRATLVTSTVTVDRRAFLYFDDGTSILWIWFAPGVQPGGTSNIYNFGTQGIEHGSRQDQFTMPLPPLTHLRAGYRINVTHANFSAGDDWSAPQLLVEEWIDI
jgi:hypothetical protein